MTDAQVDLLVVGAGMAGLAAAARAADAGAVVGVVEKESGVGGSAALSAGMLWTARDFDELRARMPDGDPELGRALVDDFAASADAVRATGVETSRRVDGAYFGFGAGWQIDVVGLFERWVRTVEAAGGWVVRGTSARRLLLEGRRVVGARVLGPDGETDVGAGAVVLATGGYQGDPALVTATIGPYSDRALVRSAPGCVGDGWRLAEAVGAGASRSQGGFYGHLMPYPLPGFAERHYLPLTQYHSIYCVLVNLHGRRFVDESRGDEYSNQEVVRQPAQRAVLVADEETRRRYVITEPYPGGEVVDRFRDAEEAGGNYAVAATIGELVARVSAWGVPAATLRETLDAPLPARPASLRVPPFHALEVQAAITFPLGGIRIDADARALDRDGRPIPGLYAAGADAGGIFDVGYAGGLASALVFGRRAAATALAEAPRAVARA